MNIQRVCMTIVLVIGGLWLFGGLAIGTAAIFTQIVTGILIFIEPFIPVLVIGYLIRRSYLRRRSSEQ